MTQNNSHAEKKQQLVHLNVGGVPFTILKETLGKYSKSMLAKLVDDYSETVKNGGCLFVDRDPKTFPWILEILREGDFKGCVPEMSLEALERELKFYKLPNTARLGIEVTRPARLAASVMPPMTLLFHDIVAEIWSCGLIYMLPVDVFVYHEYKDGRLEGGERRIFIVPPTDLNAKYVTDKGHRAFLSALSEGTRSSQGTNGSWKKLISQNAKTEFWIVDFHNNVILQLLNREAVKYDMECNCHENVYGHGTEQVKWNVLRIQYQVHQVATLDESSPKILF